MSGVEKLARVLDPAESFTDTDGEMSLRVLSGKRLAERILADPGPLLAALAEAGVLREVYTLAWDGETSMSGQPHRQSTAAELPSPHGLMNVARVSHKLNARVERRYATEWKPVERRYVTERNPVDD